MIVQVFQRLPETETFFQKALSLRKEVFVKEQGVPEEWEEDSYDNQQETFHVLGSLEDNPAVPVAVARYVWIDSDSVKIGRVAVAAHQRGKGLGLLLLKEVEKHLVLGPNPESLSLWQAEKPPKSRSFSHPPSKLILHAQHDKSKFYEKMGFSEEGSGPERKLFEEDGIMHVKMTKVL